jgi:hypothetical protein
LSTELFNDCYNQQSENFVEDFGEKVDSSNEILYKKLEINLDIEQNGEINISNPEVTETGNRSLIMSGSSGLIEYSTQTNYHVSGTIDDKVIIKDEELYPSSIKVL